MDAWGKIKPFLYLLLISLVLASGTYISYVKDELGCLVFFGIPTLIVGFVTVIYFFVMLIQIILKYE